MEGESITPGPGEDKLEIQSPIPPNQIFILSGQSNMAGRGGVVKDHHHNRWVWDKIVPPECAPNSSILRLSADLRWEEAHEPLHVDIDTGKVCGIGPGMPFANAVKNRLKTDSAVIGLVPCAAGGTAIKEWERGTHLYERMVKRTEESRKCGGEIKAVLWYQGESDVLDIHDAESYGSNMDRLIKNLRHDLNLPSLPIIQVSLSFSINEVERLYLTNVDFVLVSVKKLDLIIVSVSCLTRSL